MPLRCLLPSYTHNDGEGIQVIKGDVRRHGAKEDLSWRRGGPLEAAPRQIIEALLVIDAAAGSGSGVCRSVTGSVAERWVTAAWCVGSFNLCLTAAAPLHRLS